MRRSAPHSLDGARPINGTAPSVARRSQCPRHAAHQCESVRRAGGVPTAPGCRSRTPVLGRTSFPMNRIPVRGAGFVAAAVAAASLAWSAPSTGGHPAVEHVQSTLSAAVLVTAYDARRDGSAAELAHLHASDCASVHAPRSQRAPAAPQLLRASGEGTRARGCSACVARAGRDRSCPAPYARWVSRWPPRADGRGSSSPAWTRSGPTRVTGGSAPSNSSSGAYGIPQASPGSKMASAGSSWRTDAATQIAWGLAYIGRTYGTPCSAWAFWQDHYWY